MAAKDFAYGRRRGIGLTTALIKAALETDSAIVAVNHQHAESIASMSKDVPIRILSQNIRGTDQSFIFDHYTIEHLILDYERKIDDLERELRRRKGVINAIRWAVKEAVEQLEEE